MKKTLSFILALLTLFFLFCIGAGAASSEIKLYGFRNYDSSGGQFAFVSFSPQSPQKLTELSKQGDKSEIYCGTSLGGKIYAVDKEGVLFLIDTEKFTRTEIAVAVEDVSLFRPVEMAYNMVEDTMYLLCLENNNNEANALFTIDIKTGKTKFVNHIFGASQLKGLAFNDEGVLYGVGSTGKLYKIDYESGRAATLGALGYEGSYIQSMCFDRTTGLLYWAFYNGDEGKLISINPQNVQATEIGEIGKNAEISALCMASDAYAVNINAEEGGIAYLSGEQFYNAGEEAALVAEVTNGYTFGGWAVSKGTLSTTGELSTTLLMPSDDVSVTAFFLPKKVFQERTLFSEKAKITLSGKKIYYNAQFNTTDFTEGMEGYEKLSEKIGEKREIILSQNLILKAFAVKEQESFKKSLTVTIPLPQEYDGQKVNVFTLNGENVSKDSLRVKDSKITFKAKELGAVTVTTYRGASFIAIFFLVILVGAFLFFIYRFRSVILKSIKKDIKKINKKVSSNKKEKETKEQSENILAALDEQNLENSRYNITE